MADIEHTWRRYRRNFETYLRLERGMAGNSVEAYLHDYDHMARFMVEQGKEPEDVELADLQQLLKTFVDLGIAPTSQRRMIAGWRMFYKMLVVEDAPTPGPPSITTWKSMWIPPCSIKPGLC